MSGTNEQDFRTVRYADDITHAHVAGLNDYLQRKTEALHREHGADTDAVRAAYALQSIVADLAGTLNAHIEMRDGDAPREPVNRFAIRQHVQADWNRLARIAEKWTRGEETSAYLPWNCVEYLDAEHETQVLEQFVEWQSSRASDPAEDGGKQ